MVEDKEEKEEEEYKKEEEEISLRVIWCAAFLVLSTTSVWQLISRSGCFLSQSTNHSVYSAVFLRLSIFGSHPNRKLYLEHVIWAEIWEI